MQFSRIHLLRHLRERNAHSWSFVLSSAFRWSLTVFFHIIPTSVTKQLSCSWWTSKFIFFGHSFNVSIHGIRSIGKLDGEENGKKFVLVFFHSKERRISLTCDVNEPRCIFSKPSARTQSARPVRDLSMRILFHKVDFFPLDYLQRYVEQLDRAPMNLFKVFSTFYFPGEKRMII
jgi:hypothetical protein